MKDRRDDRHHARAYDRGYDRHHTARRSALAGAAAALLSAAWPAVRAQTTPPLRLGLAPYLSPAALMAAFRNVREHLEKRLQRPVEMRTATDFRALMQASARLEYDVVLLPAHLARLAMTDWRFEPLAATLATVNVLVLVKDSGPVRSAADLKGGQAAMLDRLSLSGSVGRNWLAQQGLAADVTVVVMPSVNSSMFALDRGEAVMVVIGDTQLAALPPTTPRGERVLVTLRDIPGPIYVARPGLEAGELARIRAALLAFEPDQRRPVAAANAALRAISAAELASLDPYAAQARKALAEAP